MFLQAFISSVQLHHVRSFYCFVAVLPHSCGGRTTTIYLFSFRRASAVEFSSDSNGAGWGGVVFGGFDCEGLITASLSRVFH